MRTKTAPPHVLIDADPIVYRCGFAAETPYYEVVLEHKVEDALSAMYFEPKDEQSAGDRMNAWIEEHSEWNVVGKFRGAKAQPVEYALQAVREQLKSIIAECESWVGGKVTVSLYLSGPDNYREQLATLRPYKGNRDPSHKPVHYQAIRDYLCREYGARVIHGKEADDQVSIDARTMSRDRQKFIIATIDKDLDQIPGLHYNYMKKVRYNVDPEEATAFFYVQCISGDPTDNIPGCYKTGTVKATRIVNGVLADSELADGIVSDIEPSLWDAVVYAYEQSKTLMGCPYADKDAEAVALETARLVKLQEYDGQLWCPPGTPDEMLP
jgi:hypothetical protein